MTDAPIPASSPALSPAKWTVGQVVWGTLVVAAVGFGFWLLYLFYKILFVLFIAIVIGTVLRPVVAWLHQRGVPPKVGVILVYLLLLAGLVGFALLLFPLIVEQTTTITKSVPATYQSVREWRQDDPGPFMESLNALLPDTLSILDPIQQVVQPSEGAVLETAEQVLSYLGMAAGGFFTVIVLFLLAYYWTVEGPRITRALLRLAPHDRREDIGELITTMETKISSYMAGQGLIMLIVGGMSFVAYWLIGLPSLFVLALVAGLMEAVPVVGPLLAAIPAGLVALSLGPDKLLLVIVAMVIIQQIESYLLVPRIMSRSVGVNPFVTLLALFAFSKLLGIPGALMAIPMAAVIQLLLNHFLFKPNGEPESVSGRDLASKLRYAAQDLIKDLRQQTRTKPDGSEAQVDQMEQVMDELESITTDLDALLKSASEKEEG